MPSYKLSYFDARGRAEVIRLLFAYGSVEYEDIRVDDWAQFKPKTPFGQMPVLEIDGKMFGQTWAIANYVARQVGAYGKTDMDALVIDQVVNLVADITEDTIKVMMERDPERKAELSRKYKDELSPKYLGYMENLLKSNGNEYFVGNAITLADVAVYDFNWGLQDRIPGILDNFPIVKAHLERVGANPKIKAYVATRKPTTM